jgi:hypothetical protein
LPFAAGARRFRKNSGIALAVGKGGAQQCA